MINNAKDAALVRAAKAAKARSQKVQQKADFKRAVSSQIKISRR